MNIITKLKYNCYIKWEDNTSNDRLKRINIGIDYILLSSFLLEDT